MIARMGLEGDATVMDNHQKAKLYAGIIIGLNVVVLILSVFHENFLWLFFFFFGLFLAYGLWLGFTEIILGILNARNKK